LSLIPCGAANTRFRPEIELLLCCATSQISADRAEHIRNLVHRNLDWDYVVEKALAHGVMPLLFRSLYASCQDSVPGAAFDRLRKLYRANAQRNLFLTSELLKLLHLLDSHGISAIPFKGPVLAVSAYKNLSLREFCDLDILVRKKDVLKAKDLLVSAGYRSYRKMTPGEERSDLKSYHAFAYLADSGMYSVDLHWAVAQPHFSFPLDPEALRGRLESMSFAGRKILTFAPEDLILVLCAHGSKHGWERLGWICDIAELIHSQPTLDWKQVTQDARELGIFKALLIAILLARNLIGAGVPDNILRLIEADPKIEPVSELVTRRLFSDQGFLARRWQEIVLTLRMREHVRHWFLYLLYQVRVALTPNGMDRAVIVLPVALSFLYYIMRPIRLILTYAFLPLVRPSKVKNPG
jgi:hypothetical protein